MRFRPRPRADFTAQANTITIARVSSCAYFGLILLAAPFHPVLCPPVAKAVACALGPSVEHFSVTLLLLGVACLVGCVRLCVFLSSCADKETGILILIVYKMIWSDAMRFICAAAG